MSELLPVLVALALGLVLGGASGWLLAARRRESAQTLARRVIEESEALRRAEHEATLHRVSAAVGDLSRDALQRASDELVKRAREALSAERELGSRELEGKKELIAGNVERLRQRLDQVAELIQQLERDRSKSHGAISQALEQTNRQTSELLQASEALRRALASSKSRGQWGERMAEDVLRAAGFVEKVNYFKQQAVPGAGTLPDFTFPLPHGYTLNMDVKFPLDNYARFVEAQVETERQRHRDAFLRDVRQRITELRNRSYVNAAQKTLPYVLLFIPNEQIFAFIHEQDPGLADLALEQRALLCSPMTLFAVLAVVRQSVENFALEQTSHEVLTLLAEFRRQWTEYVKTFETLGRQIETTGRTYDRLATTRTRALDRRLEQLDELRRDRGLGGPDAEPAPSLRAIQGSKVD